MNIPNDSPLRVMPEASGLTVLLPAEEMAVYQVHIARIFTEFNPITQTECEMVQRLANTEWRINRIARLEMGIFAAGRLQFVNLFADQDPNVRSLLIENQTFQTYARQLNNLSLQESRLRRNYAADLREFERLQQLRNQREIADPATAVQTAVAQAGTAKTHAAPAASQSEGPDFGFEFSNRAVKPSSAPATHSKDNYSVTQAG